MDILGKLSTFIGQRQKRSTLFYQAWQRNVLVLIGSHSTAFRDDTTRRRDDETARRQDDKTTRLHHREFDSADDETKHMSTMTATPQMKTWNQTRMRSTAATLEMRATTPSRKGLMTRAKMTIYRMPIPMVWIPNILPLLTQGIRNEYSMPFTFIGPTATIEVHSPS